MSTNWVAFGLGFFLGGMAGVACMCLMIVSGRAGEDMERVQGPNE